MTGRFHDHLEERVLEPARHVRHHPGRVAGARAPGDRSRIWPPWPGNCCSPRLLMPEVVRLASTVAFPGLSGVRPRLRQAAGTTTGGWAARSATTRARTGPRAENSPDTFGHFGQSGSFLWVDRAADLACVSLCDTGLRAVGGRRLAATVRPGAGRVRLNRRAGPASAPRQRPRHPRRPGCPPARSPATRSPQVMVCPPALTSGGTVLGSYGAPAPRAARRRWGRPAPTGR